MKGRDSDQEGEVELDGGGGEKKDYFAGLPMMRDLERPDVEHFLNEHPAGPSISLPVKRDHLEQPVN